MDAIAQISYHHKETHRGREMGSNHTEGIEVLKANEAHALSERVGDMNQSRFVLGGLRRGPPPGVLVSFDEREREIENVKCQFY